MPDRLPALGEGGFGGQPGQRPVAPEIPEREPDARIALPTREDQALIYRLSGDRNPLHSDPWFARELAGFPTPILHGLCTYGVAGRALVGELGESIGLTNAWAGEVDPLYGLGQTDVEGLTKLPSDTSFWYLANDSAGEDPFGTELAKNKVWTSLPFVEAGNVHRVPDAIWMFGGPRSMITFLDAVQTIARDKS